MYVDSKWVNRDFECAHDRLLTHTSLRCCPLRWLSDASTPAQELHLYYLLARAYEEIGMTVSAQRRH